MRYLPLYFLGVVLAFCSIVGCSKEASLDSKQSLYSAKTALLDSAGHPVDTSHHYPGDSTHHPGDTIIHHPGDTTIHYPGDTVIIHPGDTIPGGGVCCRDTTYYPPKDTVRPGRDTVVRY
ncbi:hypothetical protein [Chitinophaga sp. Cy-1792]|uniref:hypothetical protein n=1 Tax=Chitinophaga sp. Cy-1792 TaxID=2608339 RepID=UPI00141E4495|nr:hypothetical protein [Chitinophaga sp. Cy-1792]NIG52980.1 hypothetical protein [Chitinophaga sp. Cy-1792]